MLINKNPQDFSEWEAGGLAAPRAKTSQNTLENPSSIFSWLQGGGRGHCTAFRDPAVEQNSFRAKSPQRAGVGSMGLFQGATWTAAFPGLGHVSSLSDIYSCFMFSEHNSLFCSEGPSFGRLYGVRCDDLFFSFPTPFRNIKLFISPHLQIVNTI